MSRTDFSTELVPMDQWGKDHWSTLGYVEAVSVENAGFQVGSDPRMKTNRRHTRVLAACPRPKRTAGFTLGVVMEPVLILAVGGIVGFVYVAFFVALFSLATGMQ